MNSTLLPKPILHLRKNSKWNTKQGSTSFPKKTNNFKTNFCFLFMTLELGLASNHIIINTTSKNISRSLIERSHDIAIHLAYFECFPTLQ